MRERFYFFSQHTDTSQSHLIAVGFNFTKIYTLVNNSKEEIEQFVLRTQAQDVLVWDYNKHLVNQTYKDSLKGKLVVVAMAGLETDFLTTDFLYDFRRFAQEYRYSLDKYAFAILNMDHEASFYWLTGWQLGRFDSPSIFAIRDFDKGEYFRNYQTYFGSPNFTFEDISTGFVGQIN